MDLKQREQKIQDKRKKTPWRQYLKEIVSWRTMVFYKWDSIITKYPKTDRISGVQNSKEFNIQRDDLISHGIEYDYQQSFFDQFKKLYNSFAQEAMLNMGNCQNTSFADVIFDSQNVYMSYFIVHECEDILYTLVSREYCKRVLNSVMVFKGSENIYYSSGIVSCYNIFYSKYLNNCSDIWFSTNLQGCRNCIFCDNLENVSYCINNKQYTKEDYDMEKKNILFQKSKFFSWFENMSISSKSFNSNNVKGGFLTDCENIENGYFSYNVRNGRNIMFQGGEKTNEETYDVFIGGALHGTHMYAIQGTGGSEHAYFCNVGINNSNVFYCMGIDSCSYCFGCIGLRNKQYCILNIQYDKDDWHRIVDQIFKSMQDDGTFGKFFPGNINPFYFNDTAAYLIDDSFTKEEVEAEGFLRRDEEVKVDIPQGLETIKATELDQYQGLDVEGNRKINPEILKKVIVDEKGNSYRIIKMEYDFLIKYGLPLPEQHRLDRIKMGFRFK